jgi:heat shock protein HtpX
MDQVADNQKRAVRLAVVPIVRIAVVAVVVSVVLVVIGLAPVAVAWLIVLLALGAYNVWQALGTDRAMRVVLDLSRAEPADPHVHARLHNVVEGLCAPSGMTTPEVYVVTDTAPNALAVGRSPKAAALVVTTGLLDLLDRVELEAVIARELGLIKSNAVAPATVAVLTNGGVIRLADRQIRAKRWNGGRSGHPEDRANSGPAPSGIVLSLAASLAPRYVKAVGPGGGHEADLAAMDMTRYPPGLASAMERIASTSSVVASGTRSTAHLWLAPPIATTPDEGELWELNQRFVAHRPIVERVDALREL